MEEFVFKFEVAGEEQVKRSLSRFADTVSDFRPAFEGIAEDFSKIEKRQFDSEGASGSGKWPALSSDYAKWKARNFPGTKILELTGLMKESLTDYNPWTIRDIKPLSIRLGTRIPYAIYHQTGTKKMPARKPIQLNENDKTRWMKILHRHVEQQAQKEWSGLMPTIGAGQSHAGSI